MILMKTKNMSVFERILDKDLDMSKIDADNLVIDFDKNNCLLRISIFSKNHFCFERIIDLREYEGDLCEH